MARHSNPPPQIFDDLSGTLSNPEPAILQTELPSSEEKTDVKNSSFGQQQVVPTTKSDSENMPVQKQTVPMDNTFDVSNELAIVEDEEHLLIARYARVLESTNKPPTTVTFDQTKNVDGLPTPTSSGDNVDSPAGGVQPRQQAQEPRSPMQILQAVEANRLKDDVENRIRQLEGESARLQAEYSRLLVSPTKTSIC